MTANDNWQGPPGGTPDEQRAEAGRPDAGYGAGMPPPYGYSAGGGYPPGGYGPNGYPHPSPRVKSKWLSALLSMAVPGTGHMYLGLMTKGIAIMLLLTLNICAIVFFGVEYGGRGGGSVLVIVLLSLMLPILYFYTLFDSIQQTEALNERRASGWPGSAGWNGAPPAPPSPQGQSAPSGGGSPQPTPVAGVVLLAAGGVALFSMADTSWTRWLLHSSGSMAGAVILIIIGGLIWLWERRGSNGGRH